LETKINFVQYLVFLFINFDRLNLSLNFTSCTSISIPGFLLVTQRDNNTFTLEKPAFFALIANGARS